MLSMISWLANAAETGMTPPLNALPSTRMSGLIESHSQARSLPVLEKGGRGGGVSGGTRGHSEGGGRAHRRRLGRTLHLRESNPTIAIYIYNTIAIYDKYIIYYYYYY
jgi:hypothetical protein